MLETPKRASRGVTQIAAATSNTIAGLALIAVGLLSLVLLAAIALDVADQTWASLGTQITDQLGTDVASLFAAFQIDLSVILSSIAEQNNLPEFGAWVRQVLGLLMVGSVALVLAAAAPLWVARAIWGARSGRAVLSFGALLTLLGVMGILITGAPQIIWGLVLANGLLTLVASRTTGPSD